MNTKIKNMVNNEQAQLCICFLFFLFMCVFNLMHSSLWGDEWVEYYYSQKAIKTGDMYNAIISTFQPPLYNFVMHFWLKINQSLRWFRLFNVVIGLISALFIYKANRMLYTRKVGMFSIAILAVCFQWIYCIQECSEYALMLMCLCVAIYYYVSCNIRFSYINLMGFILFSVLAIYSQYGSVFVAIPLMTLFFVKYIFDSKNDFGRKVIIIVIYAFSFLLFAVPLYLFFLSKQLEHNGIAENTVSFNGSIIRDIPFVFGQILGYLFGVNEGTVWPIVFAIISVIVIVLCSMIIMNLKIDWPKRSIIIALAFGYVLHFVLVQMHIYAMVHPGQSAGFFARYSYFYIPICCVAFPIIICENKRMFAETSIVKKYIAGLLVFSILLVSFTNVMQNWNKANDDIYIKIWEENEGWSDCTYLYGVNFGFYYYVKQLDNYEESLLNNVFTSVDNENLPKHFWAWRINAGGDGWQTTIDKARSLGYIVTIYDDSGYSGQLAYCTLDE